ncbi:unnamed protein product [Moneuplotes crassus]|uniref:Uncharacterized protein n=1 Tax=Euplotes crassus TaxID=5936 RepID=A0AAD1Y3A3_EUPCR|nr:unnamed protein product [Moneuplotes crassus]
MHFQRPKRKVKPRKTKCIKGELNQRIREGDIVTWLKTRNCKTKAKEYTMTIEEFNEEKEYLEDALEYEKETVEVNTSFNKHNFRQKIRLRGSVDVQHHERLFSPINRYNKEFIERGRNKRMQILRNMKSIDEDIHLSPCPKMPQINPQPSQQAQSTILALLEEQEDEQIRLPFKTRKSCYLQLFGCYPALGFTKRKKRMKIFQQSLQNRRLERKIKKFKDLVKKEKKEKYQQKGKLGKTKQEPLESPVPPTSADTTRHSLRRSLRASFTDYEESKQRSKRKYYVHFLNTSCDSIPI